MSAPLQVEAVANWFLRTARKRGMRIDPMKMQKLVYFANGWHLALAGKPLVDEYFEAWEYGPVVPSVYHKFKGYGAGSIEGFATTFDWRSGTVSTPDVPDSHSVVPLLNWVWDNYGKYSGPVLSDLTHRPGEAWDRTRNEKASYRNADIPPAYIEADFKRALKLAQERASTNAGQ